MGGRKSAVLWVNQWESHVSYQPSLLYSLYLKITLVQHVAPAVWFAPPDAEPGAMREKKNPSAGHHFYWQLVNKLKKRDAGAIPPPHPHFFPLSLSLVSSVCRQLVLSPKKSSWKWWTFQVLELVVGTYITQSFASVLLHPYISDPALRCGSSLIHWSALGWKVEVQW